MRILCTQRKPELEGFTREFRGKLHECMVPWAPGILLSRMKLEELFPEDMQIKKDRLNAAALCFMENRMKKFVCVMGCPGIYLL